MNKKSLVFLFITLFLGEKVLAEKESCQDRVLVAAVGDILIHDAQQVEAHKSPERFFSLWKTVAPYINAADVAYGNLESPVALGINGEGKDFGDIGFTYDRKVYSGTNMRFNFHPQVISDIQKLGLDIVSTANNHALDRKSIGIDRTNLELKKQNMLFTGTRMSDGTGDWGQGTRVKGKNIYWLSCTEHLNGHPDHRNQVLKCFANENEIVSLVQKAQSQFDAVILLPHWGSEYVQTPNAQQRRWARKMANLGVTAIVGSHPHVMQPVERIGQTLVAYSLGNFVAWQKGTERKTSVVLYLNLKEDRYGKLQVSDYKGLPVYRVGQIIYPAINRLDSAAMHYVSKHLGRENIVMGQDFDQITRCK